MSDPEDTRCAFDMPPIGGKARINFNVDAPNMRVSMEVRFSDGTVLGFNLDPSAPLEYTRGSVVTFSGVDAVILPIEGAGPRLVYSDADPKPDEGE